MTSIPSLRFTSKPPGKGVIKATVKAFFTTEEVLRKLDAATAKKYSQFGYFTMKDARQSLRKRKSPSRPGKPPRSDSGLLKRFIYFSYDDMSRSVVIGPTPLDGRIRLLQVPKVLEYGGKIPGKKNNRDSKIDARPYMRPAFTRQVDKRLPGLFRDAMG